MSEPNKSLMAITAEVIAVERALIENDGVLPPEIEEQFNLATGDLKDKVDRYWIVLEALDARAGYFKSLAESATAARKMIENKHASLKANLKFTMQQLNLSELEGNDYRYKLSNSKPKLVIDDDALPPGYKKAVQTFVPDKEQIENDLALGMSVPGAHMETVQSLRGYMNAGAKAKPIKGK